MAAALRHFVGRIAASDATDSEFPPYCGAYTVSQVVGYGVGGRNVYAAECGAAAAVNTAAVSRPSRAVAMRCIPLHGDDEVTAAEVWSTPRRRAAVTPVCAVERGCGCFLGSDANGDAVFFKSPLSSPSV